jgi:Histidine biosynthesis protein
MRAPPEKPSGRKVEILPWRRPPVSGPLRSSSRGRAPPSSETATRMIPCLPLRSGTVMLVGPGGPRPAIWPGGGRPDPFDVVDRLARDYPLVYILDLDGIERGEPQLEYLQEFSRDVALWVDAGTRTADQAIDVLVAGAQRVVLSSSRIDGPEELERAWGLSSQLAFEIELPNGMLPPQDGWNASDPVALARAVRAIGPDHLIVSPRDAAPDWNLVRLVAAVGTTWVDGSFALHDAARLESAGAAGAIFSLDDSGAPDHRKAVLDAGSPNTPRDDEDKNQLTRDE